MGEGVRVQMRCLFLAPGAKLGLGVEPLVCLWVLTQQPLPPSLARLPLQFALPSCVKTQLALPTGPSPPPGPFRPSQGLVIGVWLLDTGVESVVE